MRKRWDNERGMKVTKGKDKRARETRAIRERERDARVKEKNIH